MILNRLNITGKLDFNTPKIVLEEIADTLSIKNEHNPNRLLLKIYKVFDRNKIKEDYENDINSLRIIARYVNCYNKNWRKSILLKAFKFLLSFEKEREVEQNFTYGLQTSENYQNLNCCVLYRLCKNYNINTFHESTLDEMAQNIKIYFLNLENSMKISLFNYIKYDAKKSDLINILNIVDSRITILEDEDDKQEDKQEYSYEDYERCANDILRIDDMNIKPKTHLQAIVMGAIYHKLDLSECDNPLKEYKYLLQSPYFPYDNNLKERLRITFNHPDSLENPYLNYVFNCNLPPNMYTQRDLTTLCWKEGLNVYDDNYYSSLQVVYLTETFIHGKQGNIINEHTTFLEDIKDLEYDDVLIYGIRNTDNFRAYTYGELSDTFSSYKRFIDPQTNEIFEEEVIEKLQLLTQKEQRNTESYETYKSRIDLGEEIERVKIYISSKNEYIEKFIEIYENLEEEDKKMVEKCLNNLLHVAMYMRNWDGESNYPLTSEDTNFPTEKQIIVDDRVTQSLIVFEKSIEEIGNFGDFILKLPLMQYHKESNKFVTSNDPSEGLTIKDRIKIVRGGEGESMNSCIRMSSNKFCSSAYYYMVLIGFRIPFSISEVSHIV